MVIALAAGMGLYQTAVMFVGGKLAALPVPKAYFDLVGRHHTELALAGIDLLGFAAPVFFIVAGGTLGIDRVLGARARPVLPAVLAGLLLCFGVWMLVGIFRPPANLDVDLATRLGQVLVPPWWAVGGYLAPWLGFGFAAWLLARSRRVGT